MASKSNTRVRAGRNTNLPVLIARMTAANDAYGVAARREDEASSKMLPRKYPKVFAGVTGPVEITANGKTQNIPSHDVFFRSHEEIDRAMKADRAAAKGPAARRKVAAERKRLHAELARDERRLVREIPAAIRTTHRAAELALTKADRAYDTARAAILNYRPAELFDAVKLLEFVTSKIADDIVHDAVDALAIMRNALPALNRARR